MTIPVLVLSRPLAFHLHWAIRDYRANRSREMAMPPELQQLEDELLKSVRSGLERTSLDVLDALPQRAPVARQALSFGEVATALGVSEKTVRRLVDGGLLRKVQIGGAVRIRPADLDTYLDSLGSGGQQCSPAVASSR